MAFLQYCSERSGFGLGDCMILLTGSPADAGRTSLRRVKPVAAPLDNPPQTCQKKDTCLESSRVPYSFSR